MNKTLLFLPFLLLVACTKAHISDQSISIRNMNKNDKVLIYTTADSSDYRLTLTQTIDLSSNNQNLEAQASIAVNPSKSFQEIIGIGGAITDASAEVFAKLPESRQQELLQAYYSVDKGIGYSLARTTIHSCDFSSASYCYIVEGDSLLTTFNIDHDRQFRIPLIKKAIKEAGGSLMLYASPWSPPAFMKSNNDMLHGGSLLPQFRQAWANYFVKFIQAYEAEGMPVWGVTAQNEALASQTWESCVFSAEDQRDFIKKFLGPTFEKNGLSDKKIIILDHNRDIVYDYANTILSDPEAAKYVWGTGFHWYETWTGDEPMFENIGKLNEAFPDKKLLFTEGCNEHFSLDKLQSWPNAERYGRAIINDFNYGTVGWTDWNILLDQTGGPNHVGNLCFAPVHADLIHGQLIYTPAYYYIGHFSKFIRPGAHRISSASTRYSLLTTSFLNTNGTLVTVVMNPTSESINYRIQESNRSFVLTIQAHAIQTIVY